MTRSSLHHSFERPSLMRRAAPMTVIVALHLGLFYLLQNGLMHQIRTVPHREVITAILFPPVPKPADVIPAPPPPKPTPLPVNRLVTPPRPAPQLPTPLSTPRPAPVAPAPDSITVPAAPAVQAAPVAIVPAPAPPPAPAPAAPATPKTITSGVQYLQPPQPDYPAQSKRLGEEGRVMLRVLINQQGRAERIEVQKSSGFVRLDEAAREAVQRAQFKPHLEDDKPITVFVLVPISFRLDQ